MELVEIQVAIDCGSQLYWNVNTRRCSQQLEFYDDRWKITGNTQKDVDEMKQLLETKMTEQYNIFLSLKWSDILNYFRQKYYREDIDKMTGKEFVLYHYENATSTNEIVQKHKYVNLILRDKVFGGNPMFEKLTSIQTPKVFEIIDAIFFAGKISDLLKAKNKKIRIYNLDYQEQYGGLCRNCPGKDPSIYIGRKLILSAFQDETKEYLVAGFTLRTRLEILITFMSHEIIHLLMMVFYPRLLHLSGKKEFHGKGFQTLAFHIFYHTNFQHQVYIPNI